MILKQWLATKPKTESSLKLTAVEGWRGGELAEGRRGRLLSLSLLCSQCADLWMEEGRRGEERGGRGSAVFSRRSFLCVGLMAPSGGRDPQSNLLSPQNTLCYKTHTPSGTNSALNFLPVILAAGQRKSDFLAAKEPGPFAAWITCKQSCFVLQERCCVRAEKRGRQANLIETISDAL